MRLAGVSVPCARWNLVAETPCSAGSPAQSVTGPRSFQCITFGTETIGQVLPYLLVCSVRLFLVRNLPGLAARVPRTSKRGWRF